MTIRSMTIRKVSFSFALLFTLCGHRFAEASPQNAPAVDVSATRRPGTALRIELIGDSTQTDNAGYGRGFCANLTDQVECINFAKGGTSTKTFRRDGIWDKALASRPDYMLIQFGHNDMVSGKPTNDRQVPLPDYEKNLRDFVTQARAVGAKPVLVTPLTRRYFGKDGIIHSDLTAYAEGMKGVAAEMNVPLIDLQALSIAYLDSIGEKAGNALGITKKNPDGSVALDKTHLNWQGSYVFGRMVVEALPKAAPALAPYVRHSPATLPAQGLLAMKVIRGESFKIAIIGDSDTSIDSGWAPGFCATLTTNVQCLELGRDGESIKGYAGSSDWAKALTAGAQFYFLDFGADSESESAADYERDLAQLVSDVNHAGAIPILLSPLHRGEDARLRAMCDAVRQVATQHQDTFVDLTSISGRYFQSLQKGELATIFKDPAQVKRPQLSAKGAAMIGRLIADNVIRTEVELGPNVKGLPEGTGPSVKMQAPTDGH